MKKHDKTQDKIFSEIDLQLANTINDLRGLNRQNKDFVLQQSCSSMELFDNAKSKMQNEEREEKLRKELAKQLKKPMHEYEQRFKDVEEIKKKFIPASDSELLPLLAELEQSMLACERAFKPIHEIDQSISPPLFDKPPTDVAQRLSWASHTREYLRNRKEKRGY